MKSRLVVAHPANLCTITEIYRPSVIFLLLIDSTHHLYNELRNKLDEVVRYGRTKSFTVIELGTNRRSPYASYYYSPL